MLIDLLLSGAPIDNVGPLGRQPLHDRLRKAQKFELASDFAAAAEGIAYDLKTVANALPHCRLPYKYTWVEVAQNHRPRYSMSGIHMPSIQSVPLRVGFLLEAMDTSLKTFAAYQFWELRNYPGMPHASNICMMFDPDRFIPVATEVSLLSARTLAKWKEVYDKVHEDPVINKLIENPDTYQSAEWLAASKEVQEKLVNAVMPGFAPYVDQSLMIGDPRMTKAMADIGVVDWSGEAIYVLAMLALMNTVNATESEPVEHGKLNKARAKRGKPPLLVYHVLKIHPRIKQRIMGDSSAHGHRELCAHLCRGHWKIRRTGIFWWSPHLRGNRAKGFVYKSYKVE